MTSAYEAGDPGVTGVFPVLVRVAGEHPHFQLADPTGGTRKGSQGRGAQAPRKKTLERQGLQLQECSRSRSERLLSALAQVQEQLCQYFQINTGAAPARNFSAARSLALTF